MAMFLYVTICIKVLNAIINLNIPLQCIYSLHQPLHHPHNFHLFREQIQIIYKIFPKVMSPIAFTHSPIISALLR